MGLRTTLSREPLRPGKSPSHSTVDETRAMHGGANSVSLRAGKPCPLKAPLRRAQFDPTEFVRATEPRRSTVPQRVSCALSSDNWTGGPCLARRAGADGRNHCAARDKGVSNALPRQTGSRCRATACERVLRTLCLARRWRRSRRRRDSVTISIRLASRRFPVKEISGNR